MQLAITGYCPHYLKFKHQLHLPIDFYFPMIRGTKNTSMLTSISPSYVNDCARPLKRLKCSPHQRQRDRSSTTIGKANTIPLEPGDLVLAKADAYRGRRKLKDQWEEGNKQGGMPSYRRCPFLPCEEPAYRMLIIPPSKLTFSYYSNRGDSSLHGCAG